MCTMYMSIHLPVEFDNDDDGEWSVCVFIARTVAAAADKRREHTAIITHLRNWVIPRNAFHSFRSFIERWTMKAKWTKRFLFDFN